MSGRVANNSIPDAEDGGRDNLRQEEGGEVSRRIVRKGVMESRSRSGQSMKNQEEFKEGVRNIEVSREASETARKEDSKRKGMLESEVIKDTTIKMKTKRVKMKQQGDQKFINRLTDNDTGFIKNLVRMFKGIGGSQAFV